MSEWYIKGVLRTIILKRKSLFIHSFILLIFCQYTDIFFLRLIMKSSSILLNIAALCGAANAFWGQMTAEPKHEDEGGTYQWVHLTDYNTGSKYSTQLPGGFDGCAAPFACFPV